MTLGDLMERLQEAVEAYGEDVEVRLMTQPNYPFEWSVAGVASLEDINANEDEDEDAGGFRPAGKYGFNDGPRPENVLYILEGRQLGYGTKTAWDAS
jgi:hypothetical protein